MGRKTHEQEVKEKRRLPEPKFFRVCPKCGSAKVAVSKAKQQEGLPFQLKCKKCGYASYFFPETTKDRLRGHSKKKIYRLSNSRKKIKK